ncbi:MAG: hypothetical protein ACK4GT_00425 [Pararhodobacter sp.]
MKALIHIGLPKAGSSSIQQFLKINREALLDRGIRYERLKPRFGSQFELAATGVVEAGGTVTYEAARLVLGFRQDGDDRAFVQEFRAMLDRQRPGWTEPLYVGSSEHIQPWLHQPARIRALDGFLGGYFAGIRYLLYLRPQAELLLSSYAERVRRGSTMSFEQHLGERWEMLNFDAVVSLWEGVLGAERLDVRLLRPDALAGGDLIADFCAAMGTNPGGLVTPPRMNAAPGAGELAFRRRLNSLLRVRRADGNRNPWYQRALRLRSALQRRPDPPLILSPDLRAQVEAQFAASNESLRARRFPERPSLF